MARHSLVVGYAVQLLAGEVIIKTERHGEALEALQRLDRDRDDLKSGWRRRASVRRTSIGPS